MKESNWCYFHPKELVIGVCALCLNQKLLLLSSSAAAAANNNSKQERNIFVRLNCFNQNEKPRDDRGYSLTSSSSPEASFISIKFEENGVPSWEKGKASKTPVGPQCNKMTETKDKDKTMIKSVVELHAKPRVMLRWRRRIGHLFQLVRLKKSAKGSHEGAKVK